MSQIHSFRPLMESFGNNVLRIKGTLTESLHFFANKFMTERKLKTKVLKGVQICERWSTSASGYGTEF